MFDTAFAPRTGVDTAVDALLTLTHTTDPWGSASPAELMATLERLQQAAHLVSACEQSLLAYAMTEDMFADHGYTSPTELLVDRLHLNRPEARARSARAKQAEPRTTLTGEPLPPKYEVLASAQAAGSVSGVHVDAVTSWLGRIERHATLEQFAKIEQRLVSTACTATPDAVATVGLMKFQ